MRHRSRYRAGYLAKRACLGTTGSKERFSNTTQPSSITARKKQSRDRASIAIVAIQQGAR